MKKSQKLLILMTICVVIITICGVISYIDFSEWTGGYLAAFFGLPLIVLFGIFAVILIILVMRTSYKEKELEVSGEKPVVVMKSKEIFTWLIICVVIGIVGVILASLDLEGRIAGGFLVFSGFPIAAIFGLISFFLFFRWRLRREEADVNQ